MKHERQLSASAIDDALYKFYRKSLDFKYSGNDRAAYIAETANYAMHYYIGTARAGTDFLKAFINLSDCRMTTAIKKCIKANAGTYDDAIRAIKQYLKI